MLLKDVFAELEAKEQALEPTPWLEHGVTEAQFRFCAEYLRNGGNGTQAYLVAHPGVQIPTAWTEQWRTLRSPKVKSCLARLYAAHYGGEVEVAVEEAVGRLAAILRANVAQAYDAQGRLLPVQDWPPTLLGAVRSYDADAHRLTLESPVAVARIFLELRGEMKNPATESADILAQAIRETINRPKP